MPKKTGILSSRNVTLRRRRIRALELREQGHTFDEIADRLGYASRASAYQSILWELRKESLAAAEGFRSIELLRLEAVGKALWPLVTSSSPDLRAVAEYVKLSKRVADLMGLDQAGQRRPPEKPPKPRVVEVDAQTGEITTLKELPLPLQDVAGL